MEWLTRGRTSLWHDIKKNVAQLQLCLKQTFSKNWARREQKEDLWRVEVKIDTAPQETFLSMWQISPGGNGLLPELEQFGKKECKKVHLLNTYANVGCIVYIIFDFHFLFLLFSVSDLTSAHSVLSSPTYISSLPHFMSCTNKEMWTPQNIPWADNHCFNFSLVKSTRAWVVWERAVLLDRQRPRSAPASSHVCHCHFEVGGNERTGKSLDVHDVQRVLHGAYIMK